MYLLKFVEYICPNNFRRAALPLPWLITHTITITDNHALLFIIITIIIVIIFIINLKNVLSMQLTWSEALWLEKAIKCHPFTFYGRIPAPNFSRHKISEKSSTKYFKWIASMLTLYSLFLTYYINSCGISRAQQRANSSATRSKWAGKVL